VLLGVLALGGGCGGDEDSAPASTEAPGSTQAATVASVLPFLAAPPTKLQAGVVGTDDHFDGPAVSLEVPSGWYGGEDVRSFGVGQGLDLAAQRFERGGIFVDVLDLPFAKAAARFEQVEGVRINSVSAVPVGGFRGRRYDVTVSQQVVLEDALGVGVDLSPGAGSPVLVDVRGTALLIRLEYAPETTTGDRAEVEKVLKSFSFPRPDS
jgi:hypothetical protein